MPDDRNKPKEPTAEERKIADDALVGELGDMLRGTGTNQSGQTGTASGGASGSNGSSGSGSS